MHTASVSDFFFFLKEPSMFSFIEFFLSIFVAVHAPHEPVIIIVD